MASVMHENQQKMSIRPMLEADLRVILEIERRAYSYPWTSGVFSDCLRSGYSCWVADTNKSIRGYGVLSVAAGESHILNVCIDPEYQGNGYGRLLMHHLMERAEDYHAEAIYLEVRPSNKSAYQLYLSLGFNEVGHRKDYYPDPSGREDALIMAYSFV